MGKLWYFTISLIEDIGDTTSQAVFENHLRKS